MVTVTRAEQKVSFLFRNLPYQPSAQSTRPYMTTFVKNAVIDATPVSHALRKIVGCSRKHDWSRGIRRSSRCQPRDRARTSFRKILRELRRITTFSVSLGVFVQRGICFSTRLEHMSQLVLLRKSTPGCFFVYQWIPFFHDPLPSGRVMAVYDANHPVASTTEWITISSVITAFATHDRRIGCSYSESLHGFCTCRCVLLSPSHCSARLLIIGPALFDWGNWGNPETLQNDRCCSVLNASLRLASCRDMLW